ncbi:MAG: helix-turn-helix domain-containing protein [Gallionellaceae bacterium]
MLKSNSLESQRFRILERLRNGSATTIELRADLDVMMPAARIFELRHDYNCEICKVMISDETLAGNSHTVALYSLISEVSNA